MSHAVQTSFSFASANVEKSQAFRVSRSESLQKGSVQDLRINNSYSVSPKPSAVVWKGLNG